MPVSQTMPMQPRYRPLPAPGTVQPPMVGDAPPGGYNDPANAPGALPQPVSRQPFSIGKAQGGEGPAFNPAVQDPTGHAPVPTGTAPANPTPMAFRPLSPLLTTPVTSVPPVNPVGSNLRGDVYTPGGDPRLTGAQSRTDAAATAVAGQNRGTMQTANEDRYRSIYGTGQVSGTMDELNGAPDRTALAKQTLADFMKQQQEQQFGEERNLGRNIAKFGRTGMQANADNYGDILRRAQSDREAKANALASSVAEGDINDRFRKVEMNTGLAERNADRGFQRGQAAVTSATNQTDRGIGDQYDQLNAATSLEDRIFGQGQSNRNEYRTERDYQAKDAQQTIENRLKEIEAQNALADLRLRRSAAQAQAGGL
jgi:hypothetical protein